MKGRAIAKGLLVAASLLLSLLLAEVALRFAVPLDTGSSHDFRVPHPVLGWTPEPGASYRNRMREATVRVTYNAEGWRDVEHAAAKPEGVYRTVVLGDSFMEAYSVELDDAFHRQAGGLLREAGFEAETINLGVGGYGTLQQLLAFREAGRRYQPDLVLLGFYPDNDVRNNSAELESLVGGRRLKVESRPVLDPDDAGGFTITKTDSEGARRRYDQSRARRAGRLRRVAERSVLLRMIVERIEELARGDEHIDPAEPQSLQAMTGDERRDLAVHGVHYCDEPEPWTRAWDLTRRILRQLKTEVEAGGARLVVFTVPSLANADERFMERVRADSPAPERLCLEQAPGFARLAGICHELGIELVDLLPAFREQMREHGATLFRRSDRHWNEAGHALAARLVVDHVLAARKEQPAPPNGAAPTE